MVSSTPNKIVDFDAGAPDAASTADQLREKSREYLDKGRDYVDATVAAAQDNPWKAAAIGAGVVAATAAAAYGATLLAKRGGSNLDDAEAGSEIDPESLPKPVNAG